MSLTSRSWPEQALRIVFVSVVITAAITGVVLLASPASTARTFSWGLGPEPLAAVVGGLYLGSAVTFAFAVPRPWPQTRGLAVGVLAWTVPTLAVTLVHLDQFDFGRFQALAWIFAFFATPLAITAIALAHERRGHPETVEPKLPAWVRVGLALVALAGFVWAVALLVNPQGSLAKTLPLDLPPLGGRFLGCWALLTATMAAYAFLRDRWSEARLSFVALVAFYVGALTSALRSFSQTAAPGRGTFIFVLGLLVAISMALLMGALQPNRSAARPIDLPERR